MPRRKSLCTWISTGSWRLCNGWSWPYDHRRSIRHRALLEPGDGTERIVQPHPHSNRHGAAKGESPACVLLACAGHESWRPRFVDSRALGQRQRNSGLDALDRHGFRRTLVRSVVAQRIDRLRRVDLVSSHDCNGSVVDATQSIERVLSGCTYRREERFESYVDCSYGISSVARRLLPRWKQHPPLAEASNRFYLVKNDRPISTPIAFAPPFPKPCV